MFVCEVVSSMKAWIFFDFLPLLYHYCVAHNDYSIYTHSINKWEAALTLNLCTEMYRNEREMIIIRKNKHKLKNKITCRPKIRWTRNEDRF